MIAAFCLLFMLSSREYFRGRGISAARKLKNTLLSFRPQVPEPGSPLPKWALPQFPPLSFSPCQGTPGTEGSYGPLRRALGGAEAVSLDHRFGFLFFPLSLLKTKHDDVCVCLLPFVREGGTDLVSLCVCVCLCTRAHTCVFACVHVCVHTCVCV